MLGRWTLSICFLLCSLLVACSKDPVASGRPLTVSGIPDQDPDKLERMYNGLVKYLSKELGVAVSYKPVIDYPASVTAFKAGDADMVWYGGLTGVQARLQTPGAHAAVQRDIDTEFRCVIIVNSGSAIQDLAGLKGQTFTFGSEISTSGRLMPQYFLSQAGIQTGDFKGEAGFSGSHDQTIKLVAAGAYDAGSMNAEVWEKHKKNNAPEFAKVRLLWTSPPFHDYHWILHPTLDARYGAGFSAKIVDALLKMNESNPEHKAVLDLFGAKRFVRTEDANYAQIEAVGRQLGLVGAK